MPASNPDVLWLLCPWAAHRGVLGPLLPAGSGCCREHSALLGPWLLGFILYKQGQTWHWLQRPSWLQQRTFGIKQILATRKQQPPRVERWEAVMDRCYMYTGQKL